MRFAEVNLFDVYAALISVMMMVAAWLILVTLRRLGDRFSLLRSVWHPSLFVFSVYVILLSSIVVVAGMVAH
jgi:protein AaeX